MKKECIAMLLAGGQGSRLYVLTENMAKPAVPFGGKFRIIDFPLSNCANSGIDTIGVLTQYRPLELNRYIGNGQPWDLDRSDGGVHILPPYQSAKGATWFKGTANAIYQNIGFVDMYDPDYVLILSGDHIYKMDYAAMLAHHKRVHADCTIAVMEVPWDEASRFGIMNVDGEDTITEFEEKLLPNSPIHTLATRYVIEHGIVQSFNRVVDVVGSDGSHNQVPAGIIAPIKVGDRTVGTLKFYYKTPRAVDRTQYALASGFAEILSTQLAIHELEVQKELTARAEVRALQAQINPHFLFNTLNTIASFTRTDPLRARELLREFSSFYRATLDNSGSLIPVSREVAQTKRYLTFEKARFGEDRVLATFDVSEDVEDTLVPAFVIQPIVENAVRHGMGDASALKIDVTVRRDGDDAILISVADDGVGMDEGIAARLFDERSARPDASSPQGGGAGVAMHNISERIHRFYGPHSYTRVESAPGKGAKVLLHLDLSESIFDIQE